jgi:tight adherence protein B
LPYLLDLLKSGLESGHTVLRALQMAARNLPDPLAGEVQLVVDKVQLGMSVPQAFDSVFRRAPIDELSLLAGAFRIQAEIGSSLGEILAHVAQSLRNRQRAERQIQALTAQSRFSAVVVTVLPFVVLLGLSIVAPGYARPLLETDVGMKLFETAIFCDVLAFLVMRRISRVDY